MSYHSKKKKKTNIFLIKLNPVGSVGSASPLASAADRRPASYPAVRSYDDDVDVAETVGREHRDGAAGRCVDGGHGVVGVGAGAPGERAHRHVGHAGRLVDGGPVLVARAVLAAHVPVPGHGGDAVGGLDQPPEEQPVEVLAERAADQVQGDRVDARVAVAQAEADDAEHVPEDVVLLRGPRVVVEPQHEHVVGQEAHGEHEHERQHRLGHLLPGAHLPHLSLPAGQTHAAITDGNVRWPLKLVGNFFFF